MHRESAAARHRGRSEERRRRRRAGMTLVEIMIVVIIMALIATAVGVAVLPRLNQARIDSTRTDAQSVRSAATMYVSEHPGGECPGVEDLTEGGYLDRSRRTTDAWDHAFSIECEEADVLVVSAGPDGQMGNEDDIR
ncbi:MAG: type II secretion system GspH family protein [Sandaracinaceae bacterium]|nr:type II secretion system GspH family protein [Sandaracinaceae bacterium]